MQPVISTLSRLLSRFFGWWFGELAACVPARLRDILHVSRPTLLLLPAGDAVRLRLQRGDSFHDLGEVAAVPEAMRSAAAEALRGVPVDHADIVVLVPDSQVLHRRLTLPLAAAENLHEILGFELDRHAPFPAEHAAFDYRVVATDHQTQELAIELVVAAKAIAERAKDEAVALGLAVTRVDVAHPDDTAQGWNLLPHATDGPDGMTLRRFDLALGAAVCVLVGLALWLPLERKYRELAAYETRLLDVQAKAADVEVLRGTIGAAVDRQQFLSRHRDAAPMAIVVLDDVSKRLPDDSWTLQLRVDRREVLLSGLAPAAAELIPVFEESPLFHDVRFAAPVTPNPRTNLQRFDLALPLASVDGSE